MHLKNLSIEQSKAGWPDQFQPHHLAGLQGQCGVGEEASIDAGLHMAVVILRACQAGSLEHTTTATRLEIQERRTYSPGIASPEWQERDFFSSTAGRINSTRAANRFKDVTLYHITAPAFSAWLAAQGEPPSVHVAAWFKAVNLPVTPNPEAAETAEERQAKRYQFCLDRGLMFPSSHLGRMPKGIGEAATALGIARQSLTNDLKAHIERLNDKCR